MKAALAALALLATGCVTMPETYAPPVQRKPVYVDDKKPLRPFVNMSDVDAPLHFIKDISPQLEGGAWRWTQQRPTLALAAPRKDRVRLAVDFTLPEITFKHTGPVTIRYVVNGNEIAKQQYATAGDQHFEQPVRPELIRIDIENIVAFDIDKLHTADDGVKFGIILTRAGFLR